MRNVNTPTTQASANRPEECRAGARRSQRAQDGANSLLDMMSDLTYIECQDGSQGQTVVVASRGSENAAVLEGSAPRSRLLASEITAWGKAGDATFEADARDWSAMSRITDCGRDFDVANRIPD